MNLILLVQTAEDAAALKDCTTGLAALAPQAIWLIHSPAVLVDLQAQHGQIDQQIAAINKAIADCANREDFEGAKQYKAQRDTLTLQKATAATEGYKTMTPEQQEAATARVFGDFWAAKPAPKMQLSMHPQHHETREWIEMLNSLKGRWPAEMPHGGFVVAWPGQFARKDLKIGGVDVGVQNPPVITTSYPPSIIPPVAPVAPIEKKPKKGYLGHPRFKQLCSLGLEALGQIVLTYRMDPNAMGGNRMKMAHAVGKYEQENNLLDNPKA